MEEMLYKLNEDVKQVLHAVWSQFLALGDIVYEWSGLLVLGALVMFVALIVVEIIWRV